MIGAKFEVMRKYNRKVATIAFWGIVASVLWVTVFQSVVLSLMKTGTSDLGVYGILGLLGSMLTGFNAMRLIIDLRYHMLSTIRDLTEKCN